MKKNAKIGLSYWGFCHDSWKAANVADTPDGHHIPRPLLVRELMKRGHEVIALQKQRENPNFVLAGMKRDSDGFPELDALFLEWRWPTWKNRGTNPSEPDLVRQNQLIEEYTIKRKTPTWIYDLDYNISLSDEVRFERAGNVVILDPAFKPADRGDDYFSACPRISFPNYASHDREYVDEFRKEFASPIQSYQYGYVGNNYERDDQFQKYYSKPSEKLRSLGVQTTVYGNWLNRSSERCDPSTTIRKNPYVSFGGRLGWYDSMKNLGKCLATTHIGKDGIYASGHTMTVRYQEAFLCGIPAFVPREYAFAHVLGSEWIVDSPEDVVDRISYVSRMSAQERIAAADKQGKCMVELAESLGTSVDVSKLTEKLLSLF